jgi:hypothetical protein
MINLLVLHLEKGFLSVSVPLLLSVLGDDDLFFKINSFIVFECLNLNVFNHILAVLAEVAFNSKLLARSKGSLRILPHLKVEHECTIHKLDSNLDPLSQGIKLYEPQVVDDIVSEDLQLLFPAQHVFAEGGGPAHGQRVGVLLAQLLLEGLQHGQRRLLPLLQQLQVGVVLPEVEGFEGGGAVHGYSL